MLRHYYFAITISIPLPRCFRHAAGFRLMPCSPPMLMPMLTRGYHIEIEIRYASFDGAPRDLPMRCFTRAMRGYPMRMPRAPLRYIRWRRHALTHTMRAARLSRMRVMAAIFAVTFDDVYARRFNEFALCYAYGTTYRRLFTPSLLPHGHLPLLLLLRRR